MRSISALASGSAVIIENEFRGVAIAGLPAELATADRVNTLLQWFRGLLFVSLAPKHLKVTGIPRQMGVHGGPTHLYVPVDGQLTTTGISAAERADTIRELLSAGAAERTFKMPGHVTPMEYHENGLLGRLGLVEALRDLAVAAGYSGSSVFTAVLDGAGAAAEGETLAQVVDQSGSTALTLSEVLRWRRSCSAWDQTGPRDVLELPYLGLRGHVYSKDGGRASVAYPVYATWLCLDGHIWGRHEPCRTDLRQAAKALDASDRGAIVLAWKAPGPAASCLAGKDKAVLRSLENIAAAELAAASPAGLVHGNNEGPWR